jgi:hypothetical protein
MPAMKYRKKPVVIEAMQFDGTKASADRVCRWANDPPNGPNEYGEPNADYTYVTGAADEPVSDLLIDTLEGGMQVSPGDWVIRGIKGEFYPCKPDIFEQTYEALDA